MKIEDLIARLQEIAETNPGSEVMLATQPGYPIAETLRGVTGPGDEAYADEDLSDSDLVRAEKGVTWLVSGGHPTGTNDSPYAPGWVFAVAS